MLSLKSPQDKSNSKLRTFEQGRALRNSPVGYFSEGDSLQGWKELRSSYFTIRLFSVLNS
jgi:hypothetical protein